MLCLIEPARFSQTARGFVVWWEIRPGGCNLRPTERGLGQGPGKGGPNLLTLRSHQYGLIDGVLTKRRMSEAPRSANQKHQESSLQTTGGFGMGDEVSVCEVGSPDHRSLV